MTAPEVPISGLTSEAGSVTGLGGAAALAAVGASVAVASTTAAAMESLAKLLRLDIGDPFPDMTTLSEVVTTTRKIPASSRLNRREPRQLRNANQGFKSTLTYIGRYNDLPSDHQGFC
ncbi:hypothetical protein [Fodinicola feengrottensis]|uniref:hypothetical protein n=1 Tax=Fodinicola feengrottensis TaxID=435914 RepID=UPI00244219D5|nr:hypothetical protein [Fodinicola feengrottensis]